MRHLKTFLRHEPHLASAASQTYFCLSLSSHFSSFLCFSFIGSLELTPIEPFMIPCYAHHTIVPMPGDTFTAAGLVELPLISGAAVISETAYFYWSGLFSYSRIGQQQMKCLIRTVHNICYDISLSHPYVICSYDVQFWCVRREREDAMNNT